jgi:cephalosporin-C deacetylase-like acetyl esterase
MHASWPQIAFLLGCAVLAPAWSAETAALATAAPFPIQPMQAQDGEQAWRSAPALVLSAADPADLRAEVRLLHDAQALHLRATAVDQTLTEAPAGTTPGELFRVDSLEVWLGREQYVIGAVGGTAVAWDYVRQRAVPGATVAWRREAGGWSLTATLPWTGLGLAPRPGEALQLALQINDVDGARRATVMLPTTMEWDRPLTYGWAFLNGEVPAAVCATTLAPPFLAEVETGAHRQRTRLLLRPMGVAMNVRVTAHGPDGAPLWRGDLRLDGQAAVTDLPTGVVAGIARVELVPVTAAGTFTAQTLEYCTPGDRPLAEYRGSRKPPVDFDAFWDARLAELAHVPPDPRTTEVRRNGAARLLRVDLAGWRGARFNAYLSVPLAPGRYPVEMWGYPGSAIDPASLLLPGTAIALHVNPRGVGDSPVPPGGLAPLWQVTDGDPANFAACGIFLDTIRGIDHALTLEQADPRRLFVGGGSRGGYFALALAALDHRIAAASAGVPAYADLDLMGRLGWSSAARDAWTAWHGGDEAWRARSRKVWAYYDAVFLAGRIRCPIVVEAGMRDSICPAPGIIDAFNRIPALDKHLVLNPEHGHEGTALAGTLRSWQRERVDPTR